ncbi:PIG-L deacetylase family protein [Cytobacillus gottheilii]|uniref:PIG-L deacetylase family protein n=1 Tax=Cytobacillus gottheilii TaxID=859144 RepID=UPI0024943059|nr:PIG-L family deacetylase [Cytobacillus gottheilii]
MASNIKRTVLNAAKPLVLPYTRKKLNCFYQNSLKPAELGDGNVLVLAPHVDDETIGLGGTILKHVKNGQQVTVAYITDGAGSVSALSKSELMQKRKDEAYEVQKLLGFQNLVFLDFPDGAIESNAQTRAAFEKLIDETKPGIIYCTTFIDCHRDHVATGRILADVIADTSFDGVIRLYEINCPISPSAINTVIDISSEAVVKEKAVDIFQSQAIDFDGFIELSKIKTNMLADYEAAAVETFLEIPAQHFPAQYRIIDSECHSYSSIFKQVNKAATLLWGIMKNADLKKEWYQKSRNAEGVKQR